MIIPKSRPSLLVNNCRSCNLNGVIFSVFQYDERPEEIIPHVHEIQNPQCSHRRCYDRNGYVPENPEVSAAINPPRFDQLGMNGGSDVLPHPEDAEGIDHGGYDQRFVAVDPVRLAMMTYCGSTPSWAGTSIVAMTKQTASSSKEIHTWQKHNPPAYRGTQRTT